jgi:hypothetical protein
MANLGLLEIVIIILVVTFILLLFFTLKKLLRTTLSENTKIFWIISFICLQIVALVAFIIYHDHIMSPDKKANIQNN